MQQRCHDLDSLPLLMTTRVLPDEQSPFGDGVRAEVARVVPNRREWLARFAALWGGSLLLGGCATWKKDSADPIGEGPNLRGYRMAGDSVVVEIAIVNVSNDLDLSDRIWLQIDETIVDPQVRQRLGNNGFRVGVAPAVLPPELAAQLDRQLHEADMDAETGAMAPGIRLNQQRHQLRSGQALQITTTPLQERVAWIMNDDGYRAGGSVEQADCQLALRTYPRRDGSVRVKLTPEIHHGAAKQGVDVANSSMIFRQYRDKQLFPSLELAVNLRPGQVMVVGTTPGADQLGHLFLSEPEGVEEKRGKLVLVRLAQVQLDDLFEQTQSFLPLETPVE